MPNGQNVPRWWHVGYIMTVLQDHRNVLSEVFHIEPINRAREGKIPTELHVKDCHWNNLTRYRSHPMTIADISWANFIYYFPVWISFVGITLVMNSSRLDDSRRHCVSTKQFGVIYSVFHCYGVGNRVRSAQCIRISQKNCIQDPSHIKLQSGIWGLGRAGKHRADSNSASVNFSDVRFTDYIYCVAVQ